MTESEICISYKGARHPNEQAQILAELNGTDRLGIMEGSHCKVPVRLNREIEDGECEYQKIVEILNMGKA